MNWKNLNLPVAAFLLCAVGVIAYGLAFDPAIAADSVVQVQVQPAQAMPQPAMQLAQYAPPTLPPIQQLLLQRHECNGENCKFAQRVEELEKKLDDKIQYNKRREAQWESFFRTVNRDMQRYHRPQYARHGDSSKSSSGAVNNGLYGEGKPATGDYGQSRANAYGTIKVTCPNCVNR